MNMYFLANSPRESTEICKDPFQSSVATVPTTIPIYNLFPSLSSLDNNESRVQEM